jgi:hypothetical protein
MNLFESILNLIQEKFIPHKRTRPQKIRFKKARRKAHKGTNWKLTKPRKGYKRVKLTGTKRYVFVKLKPTERVSKKRLMRAVGKRKEFRKD